ncbi:hypothetical protein L7F22_056569 [Adiantum nelumboides]|nr:hypothetical protein [Adiantum nelumboides]
MVALQPDKDKDEADDEFCESGISKKPKWSEDVGKAVDMVVAVTPEANMPLLGDSSNACNDPQTDWDHLLDFANSLLQEYAEHNESKAVDIPENDVLEVTMDTPRVLQVLAAFHEKAAIFFFTGRLPPMHRIRQWLNFLLQSDAVDEIFDGPRGFFEIMFKTPEARQLALQKVPLFFDGQLVHAVPWRPLAEFQEILKQECPIWVEVESCPAMYCPLLHEAMQSLGKVLVPPRSRSNNRNRLCMLWNTAHPRPAWLRLKSQGMRHMHFRLHWGGFAGHCFQCGQLGHFMAVEGKGKQVVEEETPWKEVVSRKSKIMDQSSSQGVVNPPVTYGRRPTLRQGDARSRDRQPFVQGPGSYNLRSRSTKVNEPSSSLAFDRQGRVITPWDKRYWPARGNQWNQPSSSRQPSSGVLQNAFAVLGDYMGDVCAVLAANERQVEHKQHAHAGSGFVHRDFHVFFSGLPSTQSGVMMIVHDRFRPSVVHGDVHGRFLVVEITYEELLWLVGVYAPHSVRARCSLWQDLLQCLRLGRPSFLMGDFNMCSSADQSNSPHSIMNNPESRVWDSFLSMVLKQDIWQWLHPYDSGFTFQSPQYHATWSRSDRMYIMHDDLFLPEILHVAVERQHVLSDHFPLVLHMMHQPVDVHKSLLGRLPLRFNHSFLDHEALQFQAALSPGNDRVDFVVTWISHKVAECEEAGYTRAKLLARLEALEDNNSHTHKFYALLHPSHARESFVRIENASSEMISEPRIVIDLCVQFYQELLGTPEVLSRDVHQARASIMALVQHQVSSNSADILDADITEQEIGFVLAHLPKEKSPGWDGITNELFSKYVEELKGPLTSICQDIWRSGAMPDSWKLGVIRLLPKVPSPFALKHWRPISLMGCMYKVFSRVLANRLHKFLPNLKRPAQYGFIKGRNILHNILNVQMGIDYAKKTKQEVVMVQLDLEKAFDHVSWSFLGELMHSMGFGPRMSRLIYTFSLGSQSRIMMNGGVTSPVSLTRSLRQGCPLSPLLFALATHPMLTLLTQLARDGEIVGLTLPSGQQLVGQAFADDSFMFLNANNANIGRVMEAWSLFALASGLHINTQKSALHSCTKIDLQGLGWQGLVVPRGTIVCHLGYPIGVDVTNKQLLDWISGRIGDNFVYWKSQAWPFHVRLKVAQVIMLAMLSYFLPLLPWSRKALTALTQPIRFMLWKKRSNKPGLAWVSWKLISTPKVWEGQLFWMFGCTFLLVGGLCFRPCVLIPNHG